MTAAPSVLLLDPWTPDHESALQTGGPDAASSAEVDPTVEPGGWSARKPHSAPPDRALYFVDGVRRIEARVLPFRDARIVHGLFGSVPAGAVLSPGQPASFARIGLQRFLLTAA